MATKESRNFVRDSISKKKWKGPIIDLGAGVQAPAYSQFFIKQDYVLLDMNKQACPSAEIVADILRMPQVKSDHYGVVLLCETLEHLANPFMAFKEAARILRPGGLFICTTVAVWAIHRHPKDYFRFLPDGLEYLCQVSGLKIYNTLLDTKEAITPGHCCVAAVKE